MGVNAWQSTVKRKAPGAHGSYSDGLQSFTISDCDWIGFDLDHTLGTVVPDCFAVSALMIVAGCSSLQDERDQYRHLRCYHEVLCCPTTHYL